MDIISERLRLLRKEKGLNQSDIALGANVARGTYASYENGTTPPVDTLISLATYSGVSIDYLTGQTNERKPHQDDLQQALSVLNRYLGADTPTTNDFVSFLNAAVRYFQSGSPCGKLPILAWRRFSTCFDHVLDDAARLDFSQLLNSANAAAVAALEITKMPAMLLASKKEVNS